MEPQPSQNLDRADEAADAAKDFQISLSFSTPVQIQIKLTTIRIWTSLSRSYSTTLVVFYHKLIHIKVYLGVLEAYLVNNVY